MIKASELRLGNLCRDQYSGKIIKVICIEETEIHFSGFFPDKWQAEPIPLTEEILLNSGFQKTKIGIVLTTPKNIQIGLMYMREKWNVGLSGPFGLVQPCWITYVHQLQNLYFALTGEELNTEKLCSIN